MPSNPDWTAWRTWRRPTQGAPKCRCFRLPPLAPAPTLSRRRRRWEILSHERCAVTSLPAVRLQLTSFAECPAFAELAAIFLFLQASSRSRTGSLFDAKAAGKGSLATLSADTVSRLSNAGGASAYGGGFAASAGLQTLQQAIKHESSSAGDFLSQLVALPATAPPPQQNGQRAGPAAPAARQPSHRGGGGAAASNNKCAKSNGGKGDSSSETPLAFSKTLDYKSCDHILCLTKDMARQLLPPAPQSCSSTGRKTGPARNALLFCSDLAGCELLPFSSCVSRRWETSCPELMREPCHPREMGLCCYRGIQEVRIQEVRHELCYENLVLPGPFRLSISCPPHAAAAGWSGSSCRARQLCLRFMCSRRSMPPSRLFCPCRQQLRAGSWSNPQRNICSHNYLKSEQNSLFSCTCIQQLQVGLETPPVGTNGLLDVRHHIPACPCPPQAAAARCRWS